MIRARSWLFKLLIVFAAITAIHQIYRMESTQNGQLTELYTSSLETSLSSKASNSVPESLTSKLDNPPTSKASNSVPEFLTSNLDNPPTSKASNIVQESFTSTSPSPVPNGVQERIPRIVHLVYINADNNTMVDLYRPDIQSCIQHNPDLTFILWYDWNFNAFMEKHIPEERRRLMQSGRPNAAKSDIARFFLIYHFGGIYMDLDTVCRRPLYDNYVRNESCVFGYEPPIQTKLLHDKDYTLMGNYIACVPQHPFLALLISNLEHNQTEALYHSGPFYITRFYEIYQKAREMNRTLVDLLQHFKMSPTISPLKTAIPPVHHVDSNIFHPNVDSNRLHRLCESNKELSGCRDFEVYERTHNVSDPEYAKTVVLLHHWVHVGYRSRSGTKELPQFRPFETFPSLKSWPP